MSGTLKYDCMFKILLLGDSGVGKTTFLNKYIDNTLPIENNKPSPTLGCDVKYKVLELEKKKRNKKTIKLQIWDTVGQERYATLTSGFFRSTHGIFLFYDVTDRTTFDHLCYWKAEIERYAPEDYTMALIGTKLDLERERQVEYKAGLLMANSWGSPAVPFFEISSVNGANIEAAFLEIVDKIIVRSPDPDKFNKNADRPVTVTPKQPKLRCTLL